MGIQKPTNFIFTERGDVVAIDLERMKNADAVFDIGMVCGIKHAFFWRQAIATKRSHLSGTFLKAMHPIFMTLRRHLKRSP